MPDLGQGKWAQVFWYLLLLILPVAAFFVTAYFIIPQYLDSGHSFHRTANGNTAWSVIAGIIFIALGVMLLMAGLVHYL